MIDRDALIEQCERLEPLPPTVARLLNLASNPDVDLDDLVLVVNFDPVLTARVLRIANSAAIGGARAITTVHGAISRVGSGLLLGLAVGPAVRGEIAHSPGGLPISEERLWRHSVAAASAASFARKFTSWRLPQEAFTTGLLHDLGKLVIARFTPPDLVSELEQARKETGLSSLELEQEILGLTHPEVGAMIARHWQLPPSIEWAITYHHAPAEFPFAGDDALCYVTHLADLVAKAAGEAVDDEPPPAIEEHAALLERLGMTVEGFDELTGLVAAELDEVLSWYR